MPDRSKCSSTSESHASLPTNFPSNVGDVRFSPGANLSSATSLGALLIRSNDGRQNRGTRQGQPLCPALRRRPYCKSAGCVPRDETARAGRWWWAPAAAKSGGSPNAHLCGRIPPTVHNRGVRKRRGQRPPIKFPTSPAVVVPLPNTHPPWRVLPRPRGDADLAHIAATVRATRYGVTRPNSLRPNPQQSCCSAAFTQRSRRTPLRMRVQLAVVHTRARGG